MSVPMATAWLVSFKLTGIGPFFIVLGAVVSAVPTRLRVIGKAVFYFGLIFFALDLISAELKPLQNQPAFMAWMELARAPWLGVLTGLIFTALVQSSSVTTGVAILTSRCPLNQKDDGGPSHHSTDSGVTCQISSQYSLMARSDENLPLRAVLRIDIRVQRSTSCQAELTRSWHSTYAA